MSKMDKYSPLSSYDDFWYQSGSWDRPRRVVAKSLLCMSWSITMLWVAWAVSESCPRYPQHR